MAKAAAPVKMLILCEDAALEDEGLAVAAVVVPLDDVVAVAVALLVVNVTPTAAQSDWEAASAFVRSDPVHDA